MYEDYPFWHTLFKSCGIRTVLSSPSAYRSYEAGIHTVMSDNICFPAKLAHSHIYDLIARKVDRIFFPYVIYEKLEDKNASNSYNCPIVSGYSDVLRSVAGHHGTPIDSPVITFKDTKLLTRQCRRYLKTLGIDDSVASAAVREALSEQNRYEENMKKAAQDIYDDSRRNGRITVLLAGRPYHTDPLVQHKLSDMVSDMGVDVITEDIARNMPLAIDDAHIVSQWAYINRILRAAKWAAMQRRRRTLRADDLVRMRARRLPARRGTGDARTPRQEPDNTQDRRCNQHRLHKAQGAFHSRQPEIQPQKVVHRTVRHHQELPCRRQEA